MSVLKAIDDLQDRLWSEYGDVLAKEYTQHERHLTWYKSKHSKMEAVQTSPEHLWNQKQMNDGYRIGKMDESSRADKLNNEIISELIYKLKEMLI